ncbi:response regulator transcription factor [Leptospira sp. GIMC2001]|uniref:response regulator transcription factor n=1 Tax=Leptospira sp. GIMC2001 TaxID=1513297 RepID=UPI00234A9C56|nr:response regulator transcription factor [Leptospira sp. GIMC2001]WCL49099.1 response regulator transcription factor [Leptospira sp. GIMC2001]
MNIGIVENEILFAEYLIEEIIKCNDSHKIKTWKSAESFWRDPTKEEIDILLVDIGLPGMDGIELLKLYHEKEGRKSIVISSMQGDDTIFGAIRLGTSGYILKSELSSLCETLDTVANGGATISPSIAARVLHQFRNPIQNESTENSEKLIEPVSVETLSKREKQILEEIINGLSAIKIAELFGTTDGTVRQQIKNIYKKLQVNSRVELMRKARDLGMF